MSASESDPGTYALELELRALSTVELHEQLLLLTGLSPPLLDIAFTRLRLIRDELERRFENEEQKP